MDKQIELISRLHGVEFSTYPSHFPGSLPDSYVTILDGRDTQLSADLRNSGFMVKTTTKVFPGRIMVVAMRTGKGKLTREDLIKRYLQ